MLDLGFRPDNLDIAIKADGRSRSVIAFDINSALEARFGELPNFQLQFSPSKFYRTRKYKSVVIASREEAAIIFGALKQTKVAFDSVLLPERLVFGTVARQQGKRYVDALRHVFNLAIEGQLPSPEHFEPWLANVENCCELAELVSDPDVMQWVLRAADDLGLSHRDSAAIAALRLYNQTISERRAEEEADLLAIASLPRSDRKPASRRLRAITDQLLIARENLDLRRFDALDTRAHGTIVALLGEEPYTALVRVLEEFLQSSAHQGTMREWECNRSSVIENLGVVYMDRTIEMFDLFVKELNEVIFDGMVMGGKLKAHLEDYRDLLKGMA